MQADQASLTAETAAALRAHHFLTVEAPRLLDDSLAMPLAGWTSPVEVERFIAAMTDHFATMGDRQSAEALVQHVSLCVCARSRIAEDRLEIARRRGVRQLVILGAGLDSTAYRRRDLTTEFEILEVDHPATQARKRERLAAAGIAIPPNLRFVPFDFEQQTLAEALRAGRTRGDRMTFFTWMGVQPYLTDATVMATLDVVAGFPAGSEIDFDVMTPPDPRQQDSMSAAMQSMMRLVAEQGEPFKSVYVPEELRARLAARGFAQIDMVVFHDWLARNAEMFGGRLSTPPGPCIQVCAIVG
jgi:methyltransferase (TIGR00027 family)